MAFQFGVRSQRAGSYVPELTPAQKAISEYRKRSVQGVFDTAYYGYDIKFDLGDPTLSVSTFTYSSGITASAYSLTGFSPAGSSVNYMPMLHSVDSFFASDDTVPFLHTGNNTAFSKNYIIDADMTAAIHQLQVCAAFVLNVSAWTNGTANLDSVTITAQPFLNNNQPLQPAAASTVAPSAAFTPLGATGLQLFFVRAYVEPRMKVYASSPIIVNIKINTTISGTNTVQVGMLPRFSYITNNILKEWYKSQIIAHVHPLPEHVDEIASDTHTTITGMMSPE